MGIIAMQSWLQGQESKWRFHLGMMMLGLAKSFLFESNDESFRWGELRLDAVAGGGERNASIADFDDSKVESHLPFNSSSYMNFFFFLIMKMLLSYRKRLPEHSYIWLMYIFSVSTRRESKVPISVLLGSFLKRNCYEIQNQILVLLPTAC